MFIMPANESCINSRQHFNIYQNIVPFGLLDLLIFHNFSLLKFRSNNIQFNSNNSLSMLCTLKLEYLLRFHLFYMESCSVYCVSKKKNRR